MSGSWQRKGCTNDWNHCVFISIVLNWIRYLVPPAHLSDTAHNIPMRVGLWEHGVCRKNTSHESPDG